MENNSNPRKYTLNGGVELHSTIEKQLNQIRDAVITRFGSDEIKAIILIGGYGRGEGCVFIEEGQEKVYNDYDFFIVVRNMSKRKLILHRNAMNKLGMELTNRLGIEVDFFSLTMNRFRKAEFNLMNYEAKQKSIIVYGPDNILSEMPDFNHHQIPFLEGTRLLLNRGALLVYIKNQMVEGQPIGQSEWEKQVKYLFKAALAIGDAYLILKRKYDYRYEVKTSSIQKMIEPTLTVFKKLCENYLEAVEFKMKVDYSLYKDRDLRIWFEESVQLYGLFFQWYEEQRLGRSFSNWSEYGVSRILESWFQSPFVWLKNLSISIREFGISSLFKQFSLSVVYPRTRLMILMPYLLFASGSKSLQYWVKKLFHKTVVTYRESYDVFWQLWLKYS